MVWVTGNLTDSVVQYGKSLDDMHAAKGAASKFVDGGTEKRSMFIHKVIIQNLEPNQKYCKYLNSVNFLPFFNY